MSVALLIPVLICALVVIGLALLLRNFASVEATLPVTAEWINKLSTDPYLPMVGLLNLSDIELLRSQPGYTAKMESRMRAQRCQVFRGYLRCLNMDFKRVATALKVVMTQSEQDRPDLATVLIHHQIRFASGMLAVQCRLFLYERGIGCVDVTTLIKIFDQMRIELGSLVPATEVFA